METAEAQEDRIQRAALVGQLAGGILHDFNNILTVIIGAIDILAEAMADRPDLMPIAKLIDEAAARGARLTAHLLAFARGQPSHPQHVDVNALLAEAIRLLRPALGIQMEMSLIAAPDVAAVLADPDQLIAAVLGLAVSARNTMPDGGRLTFETVDVRSEQAATAVPSEVVAARGVVILVRAFRVATAADCPDRIFGDLALVEDFARRAGGDIRATQLESDRGLAEIHLSRAVLQTP